MESPRLRTAKAYIGHFASLDPVLLASLLADNYTHIMAPASLGIREPLTKQGFLAHNANLRKVLSGFPVYPKKIVESESANSVVVWATSRTIFRQEAKVAGEREEEKEEEEEEDWEYEGEYVFLLEMDESGEKVVRTMEFLDSKKTEEGIRPLVKKARERLAVEEGSGGEGVGGF